MPVLIGIFIAWVIIAYILDRLGVPREAEFEVAAKILFIGVPITGLSIWALSALYKAIREEEAERASRREAEKRQQLDEARAREQQAAARARAVSDATDLVYSGQISAASLSPILSAGQSSLDRAEKEFSEGLYSPFWEAMEEAAQYLKLFDDTLVKISQLHQQYLQEADKLGLDRKKFSLRNNVLPDPAATRHRAKTLYRKAQKRNDFAQIYELRRNTSAVIAGFRSLGDAIYSLGDKIQAELESLQSNLNFQLGDVNAALRDATSQLQRQHEALLSESKRWNTEAQNGQTELIAVSRSKADSARRSAEAMRGMLDNIQRGRKPGILGY